MAQILLDLFSDLSAFYPTFPFQDEASVRQPVHMNSPGSLAGGNAAVPGQERRNAIGRGRRSAWIPEP